jgi:AraC family ethanolamine operon transcriptional activator
MDGLERDLARPDLRRLEFGDPDALAALLKPWGADITQLGRISGVSRLVWARLGGLEFRSVAITGRHHVGGVLPAGSVTMQFDLGSDGPRRVGGQEVGTDEILVGLGGTAFDFTSPASHRGMNLGLPQSLVAAAMDARAPGAALMKRPAVVHIMSNCGPAVGRIGDLVGAAFGPDVFGAPEHVHGDIVDALVGTLLLPWERGSQATMRVPYYQRLPIVRRIDAFMRANLGEPLMLHDLCVEARASERAVEYAFRDIYGVGAKQYLKLLRLNRVRHDLRTLPPDIATVTDTAGRYGFWHMGHFAVAYRRLFGETPRQTRAQRSPVSAWESESTLIAAAD